MPRHSKTSAVRIHCADRAGQALELRKAGLPFREIGSRMGVTEGRAHQIVTRELERLNARRAEAAEAVTRLECERLDSLLAAVWDKAMGGSLSAVDSVLAILARRAKLLGLDRDKGGTLIVQQAVAQTVAMSPEERKSAVIAILTAAARPSPSGDGEARQLLEFALATEAGAPVEVNDGGATTNGEHDAEPTNGDRPPCGL